MSDSNQTNIEFACFQNPSYHLQGFHNNIKVNLKNISISNSNQIDINAIYRHETFVVKYSRQLYRFCVIRHRHTIRRYQSSEHQPKCIV